MITTILIGALGAVLFHEIRLYFVNRRIIKRLDEVKNTLLNIKNQLTSSK